MQVIGFGGGAVFFDEMHSILSYTMTTVVDVCLLNFRVLLLARHSWHGTSALSSWKLRRFMADKLRVHTLNPRPAAKLLKCVALFSRASRLLPPRGGLG